MRSAQRPSFDLKTAISIAGTLSLGLATSACASLPSLMREQRYPEAICKVYDSNGKDVQVAAPQLAALGHPRWRLRRILPDAKSIDDPVVAKFYESHVIVLVETQAEPVAGLEPLFPRPGLIKDGLPQTPTLGLSDAIEIYDLGSVARVTGETLPMSREVITHVDWGAVLIAAATAGFSLPFVPLGLQTARVDPTPLEVAAAVPHAIAITRALQTQSFPLIGWWFAMEKKGNDVAHIDMDIALSPTHIYADGECFEQLVVRFAPIDVAMPDAQMWPAGQDFRPFKWEAILKADHESRNWTPAATNHD